MNGVGVGGGDYKSSSSSVVTNMTGNNFCDCTILYCYILFDVVFYQA